MTDLLPFEAYRSNLTFRRLRLGAVVGVLFGVLFALLLLAMDWHSGWTRRELLSALGSSLVASLAFGVLFPRMIEGRVREAMRSVYDGRGSYATVPPARGFTHRLPGSLARSARTSIGGVLYVGPSRIAFVPHSVNLPAHRVVVDIPRESLEVAVRPARLTAVQRFLAPEQLQWLSLSAADESWDFVVPTPAAVAAALRSVLAGHS